MAEKYLSNVVQERPNGAGAGGSEQIISDGVLCKYRVAQSSKSGRRCGCIASVWSRGAGANALAVCYCAQHLALPVTMCTYVTSYRRNHFSQLVPVRRENCKERSTHTARFAILLSQLRVRAY